VALFLVAVGLLFGWATARHSVASNNAGAAGTDGDAGEPIAAWLGWVGLIGSLVLSAVLVSRANYQIVPFVAFVALGLALALKTTGRQP